MPLRNADAVPFRELVSKVYAFYRADCSDFALDVWWAAMQPFSLAAVQDAFNRHAVNPDTGQFLPKPADIVRLLGGTTLDQALTAWTKVDYAIRTTGPWASVVFDDALIHRTIADMGGWVKLCGSSEQEYPFVAKDFQNRYRGFAMQGNAVSYPSVLVGIAQSQNAQQGYMTQPPTAIGNVEDCKLVFRGGSDRPRIQTGALQLEGKQAPRLGNGGNA